MQIQAGHVNQPGEFRVGGIEHLEPPVAQEAVDYVGADPAAHGVGGAYAVELALSRQLQQLFHPTLPLSSMYHKTWQAVDFFQRTNDFVTLTLPGALTAPARPVHKTDALG